MSELLPEWVTDNLLLMDARRDLVAERWSRWFDDHADDDPDETVTIAIIRPDAAP